MSDRDYADDVILLADESESLSTALNTFSRRGIETWITRIVAENHSA